MPPLSLYVHIPWCVQKCPYCDFNSHGLKQRLPEQEYVAHLLDDLAIDASRVNDREVSTIFIGGGTPSLFSADAIASLLSGIRSRVNLANDAEITLEANPGTVETERFNAFQQAGVNRISIGVQSFQSAQLQALGRIHDGQQAKRAAGYAHQARLRSFNVDLMHGLPQQNVESALQDLSTAIEQLPPHLSWYQLTIEPNTQFASRPPVLPDDDILWDIQSQGHTLLTEAGYTQYEISAYSLPGHQCQHNLNYWRFGDYLGIGCGAHGKITDQHNGSITRTVKVKHPRGYMDIGKAYLSDCTTVSEQDLPFEFFMNRFRLLEPCPVDDYERLTGSPLPSEVKVSLGKAQQQGLISCSTTHWQVTQTGHRYLNNLLGLFV
ncbi:radical SAM family heme chaperone HemW [Aestuariibacter salexigens]|uniref:radical SAM family heme chaperone HemW n=1 Tax=Aestuariibacter salexigens TaxID=226010 RepID=UPI000407248B|nr:radical SAM family heme chaperone HemW [Aestuariibacter salexigens]